MNMKYHSCTSVNAVRKNCPFGGDWMKLMKKLQSAGLLHKGTLVRHTAALETSDFLSACDHTPGCVLNVN